MTNSKNSHDTWNEPSTKHWGIDISSTKIEGIIVDEKEPNKPLCRMLLPVESFHIYDHLRGYEHIIDLVQLMVTQLENTSGISRPTKIGISTPGVTKPSTGILRNPSFLCLSGQPVKADLSAALNTEVALSNDANCFALGEALLGAGQGYGIVVGLILSQGIGHGTVVQGHLVQGLHGMAGEWGHNRLYNEDTPCHCGKKGCNETVFSELALQQFYENITGEELAFSEIVKRAKENEQAALETLLRLQDTFAIAIADIINILDPEIIVIGGNLGAIDLLYEESTRHKILQHIYSDEMQTRFTKPAFGDSARAFGAAMLTGSSAANFLKDLYKN